MIRGAETAGYAGMDFGIFDMGHETIRVQQMQNRSVHRTISL